VSGRRGRKRKQLLDELKEKSVYWKLKKEALDRAVWRTCFGRSYRLVVSQTTARMNDVDGSRSAHETSLHEVCAQRNEIERKRPLWRPKRKWETTLGRCVTC
jgi:lipase chaperone LimK